MSIKNVLVILGHPDAETFTGSVADHYQAGAESGGHMVERINLGELQFDPILHKGYKEIQQLEPDLLAVQEKIAWADHLVIVYPNWWVTMPALLKSFFDRIWLPGFVFNFNEDTKKVEQHLKGKTARVIVTSGTHGALATWWNYGDFTNEIQHGILGFAGIKSKVKIIGPCDRVDNACRIDWMEDIEKLGAKAV